VLLQTGDVETAQAKVMHKIHRALATGGMHGIDLHRVSQFQQQDMFDNGRKAVIDRRQFLKIIFQGSLPSSSLAESIRTRNVSTIHERSNNLSGCVCWSLKNIAGNGVIAVSQRGDGPDACCKTVTRSAFIYPVMPDAL
jgi:hypothetical protein